MKRNKKYKASKHSWDSIFKKKKKKIRNNRVRSNSDFGHASITGFKPAEKKFLTTSEREEMLKKIEDRRERKMLGL